MSWAHTLHYSYIQRKGRECLRQRAQPEQRPCGKKGHRSSWNAENGAGGRRIERGQTTAGPVGPMQTPIFILRTTQHFRTILSLGVT